MRKIKANQMYYLSQVPAPDVDNIASYADYVNQLTKANPWITETGALELLIKQDGFHVRRCGRTSLSSLLYLRQTLNRFNSAPQSVSLQMNIEVRDHHAYSADQLRYMRLYSFKQMEILFAQLGEFAEARAEGLAIWLNKDSQIMFGRPRVYVRPPNTPQAPRFTKFFD